MINRMNNLSMRNKLRVFTFSTSFLLTVFLLVTVLILARIDVQKKVKQAAEATFSQFRNAEQTRLQQNLQAGEDVAVTPQLPGFLKTEDKTALCKWGNSKLGHSGLAPEHHIPGETSAKLALIALLTPDNMPLGIITSGM